MFGQPCGRNDSLGSRIISFEDSAYSKIYQMVYVRATDMPAIYNSTDRRWYYLPKTYTSSSFIGIDTIAWDNNASRIAIHASDGWHYIS